MSAHHANITPEELLGFSLPEPGEGGVSAADARSILSNLRALKIRWDLFGPHVAFDTAGYFRKRLFRDRDWEMLILCWLPGHTTVVHDHGHSWGATAVLSGQVHEQGFEWNGEGRKLVQKVRRDLPAPKLTVETHSTIHRVSNQSLAPAVSLHLYS